jgi:hypothetical protein
MGLSLLYVTLAREFLTARLTRRATALYGVAALVWVAVSVSRFQDASLETDFAAPDGTCTPRPQQLTMRLTWDGDRQAFERDGDRGPR